MKVSEIMHKGLDSVTPRCSVESAARKMRRQNIGIVGVCQGGRLKGVLTDRDIVLRVVSRGFDPARTPVEAVMTLAPLVAYEEADLDIVARKMEERKVRRVPIVDREERLVGMLSVDDFTKRGESRDLLGELLESAAARHA